MITETKNLLKFQFDYLNNLLWRVEEEYNYEISEELRFTGRYGDIGFVLDPNQTNHWISFTVYEKQFRVFYKKVEKDGVIIHYQKDVPIDREKERIEFELTADDIIMKRDDEWIKSRKK